MRRLLPVLLLAALTACGSAPEPDALPMAEPGDAIAGEGSDWPQFLGPTRDGHSPETGLPADLSDGPVQVWRREIGPGFSGVAVAGDALYTAWNEGDAELLFALDAASGAERWRVPVGPAFEEQYGDGPRATPTVAGGVVYMLGSTGELHALEAGAGVHVWSVDLAQILGIDDPDFRGCASSPLIDGDRVIVQMGPEPDTAVVALDRNDGSLLWRVEQGRSAHSSPIAVTIDGVRQIIAFIGPGLVGLDAADGRRLWLHETSNKYDLNIVTPLSYREGLFFISSGYDVGSAMIAVARKGEGWEAAPSWTNRTFQNHFATSVIVGDAIYGFHKSLLKCIDARTGDQRWVTRGYDRGTLIHADGKLIVLGGKGKLGLIEADPDAFVELGSVQALGGQSWTAPALSRGRLYLRNHEELICLRLGS